ncbi:MAG: YkgJ family cysteine cluster protein [Gammaproteobacteria bacterium]|nr:YkgJ family cysteine cluster protein [Gammaproteobacteria bacterium]
MKECNQCGKCCINYGAGDLSASVSEIDWWEQYRPDIFLYVRDGKIWFDPVTGEAVTRCPWLRKLPKQNKYSCRIYEVRPEDCRYYPVTIDEMIVDDCEMLEACDLKNTRQAQIKLDRLMADSRPPVIK